ncbi:hypothetical protein F5888DRAFT_1632260 [Russula emetica]|nr:hypothetical protein F5888DRAFT_1632260 [Russula emetica]
MSRQLASQHDLKLHGRSTRLPGRLAQIALSTNNRLSLTLKDGDLVDGASMHTGPTTVLDRAVMEHNVLASSWIYNNISFSGFVAREENDAQGKAGGLGDVNQDTEDTGSLFTK